MREVYRVVTRSPDGCNSIVVEQTKKLSFSVALRGLNMQPESLPTCPACDHAELLAMPTNACQWFCECTACKTLLKPKPWDGCVFCFYGSMLCPPVQSECDGYYRMAAS